MWNWSNSKVSHRLQRRPAELEVSLQGKGRWELWVLDFTNCICPGKKDPRRCFGQVVGEERGAGVGVYLYLI